MIDLAAVLRALAEEPLALWPDWLKAWLFSAGVDADTVAPQLAALDKLSAPRAAIHPATERATARRQGAVAVLPVMGPISARPDVFERYGLGTSSQTILRNMRSAVADPDVKAVVLDIDSPGGVVPGIPELAAEIRGMRGAKPIVAHADWLAASAAYWLASAADEIIASPSALVGSIGVYSLHVDWSAALATAGIKPTLIHAGKFKVEGNPFEPLDKEAKAAIQARVDQYYSMFLADVAKGRGTTAAAVRDGYGQGRVLSADDALAAGMIDKVRTMDETLAAYGVSAQALPKAPPRGRALALARRSRELAALEDDF